ncbi:toll/interleukin-1 receptor domain-containing protein [Clostridium swellfunianum]|uniref:toll/interleukin-1 receptor domain-containing protein n=1 Tax=Clostridium swellfunianum TaxID=1367462 RepID=UPI0020302931|nr:toll/interleukin-1 receptor domain-containing protein [Clostridium swellfunianum]MCM0648439.1 toll/interleukin-1 receptor domain-containing protein [Clostridium swellfunianum]
MDIENIRNMNQWLYQKLQKWLDSLSNKELECLDYDRFARYSGISSEEANEYFKFLNVNGLIIQKQVSLCPNCGEECVIDTSLNDNEFECEECESTFNFISVRRHSTLLYKLNNDFLVHKQKNIKSQFNGHSNIIDISRIRGVDIENAYDRENGIKKIKVFLSYCHEDEGMKKELDKALIMLKRNKKVETWNDRCLIAGSELEKDILENLKTADIILLLVSTDFLVSPYCFEKEMKMALERHKNKSAVVIPVILRICDWLNSELKDLVAVPKDGKPIKSWNDPDAAYFEVKQEIEKAINTFIDKT